MNVLLRRSLPALALAGVVWAIASSLFTIDVTEYGLVTRFGRVVRVVAEPGLYVTVPFDRVVRLDKRVLFSRLPRSEYLTVDKKNIVIESLATWRIADPERFLGAFTSEAVAEQLLGDAISATIGSVLGQFPASALISADPAESRYRPIISAIARQVADFARPAYGIDVISLDIRGLSLPERNRAHVFDRMTAERAKIAKENRSAGELQARKITAEADHERVRIEAEAAGAGDAHQGRKAMRRLRAPTPRRSGRTQNSTNSCEHSRRTTRSWTTKRRCFCPRMPRSCARCVSRRSRPPASRRQARPVRSARSALRTTAAPSLLPMPIGF